MYGLCLGERIHNEATKSRIKLDNDDEDALVSTFRGFNVFAPRSYQESLQNLATKDLATSAIHNSLLNANNQSINQSFLY